MEEATMDIRHILVPCDFSETSAAALRYARLFVAKFSAKLTVMYADPMLFPIDVLAGGGAVAIWPSGASSADQEVELRRFVTSHVGAETPFDTRVVLGSTVPMIVKTATDMGADLIMMSTHGYHGWRGSLTGVVTLDVLHSFDGQVLVIEPTRIPSRTDPRITKILCPVNMTDVARDSLSAASSLANRFGAELLVVHVVEHGAPAEGTEAALRTWLAPMLPLGATWRELVLRGGAAERVLDCADDLNADLLVIGAQHKFFGDKTVIGTTTERVIRFARCPVLAVTRKITRARTKIEVEKALSAVS
jgi:nucleotide-binding universal stress UspA family protein